MLGRIVKGTEILETQHLTLARFKTLLSARHRWLMPVILAIWEAEIQRIAVGGHPGQIILKN
jgi:hypothetical protein